MKDYGFSIFKRFYEPDSVQGLSPGWDICTPISLMIAFCYIEPESVTFGHLASSITYETAETALSTKKRVTLYRLTCRSNWHQNLCGNSLLHCLVTGHDTFLKLLWVNVITRGRWNNGGGSPVGPKKTPYQPVLKKVSCPVTRACITVSPCQFWHLWDLLLIQEVVTC